MRVSPANQNVTPRPKALVLGQEDRARPIAEVLEGYGFEPWYQSAIQAELTSPSDGGSIAQLKAFLQRFLLQAGPSGDATHCLHPGATRWADRPELPLLCQELGINPITPPARVVSLFANKLNLLAEADSLGIGHLVMSFDPIHSAREVEGFLRDARYRLPFVLKSVRSGGGFGIFVVRSPDDLAKKFPLWLEQLRRNFGDAILFPERYLESARRVVVPFVRFNDGRTELFAWTDASLQSKFRKFVEFCPVPSFDQQAERKIREWTLKFVQRCGFVGAGSLEFFVDGPAVYLLDGAARLNLGFKLWERFEGTSAVAWQLSSLGVGSGPPPERSRERSYGGSACIRIFAEDPMLQLPQPGMVRELSTQREWKFSRACADLSLGVQAGKEVPPPEDGLLGVLHVSAADHKQALMVARGVMDDLWIAGSLQTNERFISELLAHPLIEEGMFHASFVDEDFLPQYRPESGLLESFVSACVSGMPDVTSAIPGARWAVGDQWVQPRPELVKWINPPLRFAVGSLWGVSGVIEVAVGRSLRLCAYPTGEQKWLVRLGKWTLPVRQILTKAKTDNRHRLLALTGGRVHAVYFREGSLIPPHEPLVIVESLRTLVPHALPIESKILKWNVIAEQIVRAGEELAIFAKMS